MAKAIESSFLYLKSSNFLRTWKARECAPCDVTGSQLTYARAAPRTVHQRPKVEVPERPHKEVAPRPRHVAAEPPPSALKRFVKAYDAVEGWMNQPSPIQWRPFAAPAPPPPPKPPAPPPPLVPLFDLQEIPGAMRKVGMPVAAKLQERWFAGQENYSRSKLDLQDELDQNGQRYSPAFVDSTTVTMEWVLSFRRAKHAFDELVRKHLETERAREQLRAALIPYQNGKEVLGWRAAGSDLLQFHKRFQFQFQPVNSTLGQKFAEFLRREAIAEGVPDDLTGTLGAFNFYAAVQYARFDHSMRGRVTAEVTHISVYVRDAYEFSGDQYLGHWNAKHVAVVPAHEAVGGSGASDWLRQPIKDAEEGDFFYPVTNEDYRNWRQVHRKGGDFMIYTDRLQIRLDRPIRVVL